MTTLRTTLKLLDTILSALFLLMSKNWKLRNLYLKDLFSKRIPYSSAAHCLIFYQNMRVSFS